MTTENTPQESNQEMSSKDLDSLVLSKSTLTQGMIKAFFYSLIALVVFFVSATIGEESQIVFGFIYTYFIKLFGDFGLWIVAMIISFNFLLICYVKMIDQGKKLKKLHDFYHEDGGIIIGIYFIGALYTVLYAMSKTFPSDIYPQIIVGASTGGSVIPPIVVGVLWIILVGAVFMPLLLNYGVIELIGALLEPFMRPLFKIPGKAALDASASFVSSSSLAVLITARLYHQQVYTQREAVAITTSFSAVSIGFAYLVIDTAKMSHMFTEIYAISFLFLFIIAGVVVRIPPLSRKQNKYVYGREQSKEELASDAKIDGQIFKRAVSRAVKRASIAKPAGSEILSSVLDSSRIIPKVLSMLSAIGVSALILAEYTPVFEWIGLIFYPLLELFQVPEAKLISASIPVGIAEMFLPVLLIKDQVDVIPEASRFFICVVSMVQIIFFSETGTVMLASKLPIKFSELIICFTLRTLIAIPLAAGAMHYFY